jgi:hypothetical protein
MTDRRRDYGNAYRMHLNAQTLVRARVVPAHSGVLRATGQSFVCVRVVPTYSSELRATGQRVAGRNPIVKAAIKWQSEHRIVLGLTLSGAGDGPATAGPAPSKL